MGHQQKKVRTEKATMKMRLVQGLFLRFMQYIPFMDRKYDFAVGRDYSIRVCAVQIVVWDK